MNKLKSYLKRAGVAGGTVALVIAGAAAFSAFEAHVINVTAQIENALQVNTEAIQFGTVFPQEQLDEILNLQLARSFEEEDRVDDVEYIIRQKPKCAWTTRDGQQILSETQSGHVDDEGEITCPDPVPQEQPQEDAIYGSLPLLCPYLSKHPIRSEDDPSDNDGSLNAFHQIGEVTEDGWVWNDVAGRLAKSENDHFDLWNIDLKVPCFGGFCAQDWEDFVHGINEEANPDDYTQPIENEHKIFGCDLWVEVTDVSRNGRLTVIKIVDGGDADVSDFDLFVDATQVTSGDANYFPPDTYTVSESGLNDYEATFSGDCSDNGDETADVSLGVGDDLTCTIINTFND